jgi:hypothetical protein
MEVRIIVNTNHEGNAYGGQDRTSEEETTMYVVPGGSWDVLGPHVVVSKQNDRLGHQRDVLKVITFPLCQKIFKEVLLTAIVNKIMCHLDNSLVKL